MSILIKRKSAISRAVASWLSACALSVHLSPANAIGADSDGLITPIVPLGIIYQSHTQNRHMYAGGSALSNNALFRSDVTLLRALYPFQLSKTHNIWWTPNLLLPWVHLRAGGDISGWGTTRGFGDLAFVSGFWRKYSERTHLAVVPFVWFPTGKYDLDRALNPGENRYKFALQIGGQIALGDSPFDFTGSFDITRFGRNKDADLKQEAMMEWSGWLRYRLPSSMGAHFGLGLAHLYGGETRVTGIAQHNRTRTTRAKLQFGSLIDHSKTNHLLFTFARDLKVENGLRVNQHFELRYLHAF